MRAKANDFPLLAAQGLYAADIRGDGNCLFNALSDQLYGTQNEHHAIRSCVIAYMREHAAYYKEFIDVHAGAGTRRNPKRKNTGAFSAPVNNFAPTTEEVDRVFESHLKSMAKGGTYGDNMEITAFSAAFEVDVKLYQKDNALMISAGEQRGNRPVVHIAHHTWEHFSSIRNMSGPHTGHPQVGESGLSSEKVEHEPSSEKVQKKEPSENAQNEQSSSEKVLQKHLSKAPYLQHNIDVLVKSLPYLGNRITIERTLKECDGNLDHTVSRLVEARMARNLPLNQRSPSLKREPDSDDESGSQIKRQDRRLSRATVSPVTIKTGRDKGSVTNVGMTGITTLFI